MTNLPKNIGGLTRSLGPSTRTAQTGAAKQAERPTSPEN